MSINYKDVKVTDYNVYTVNNTLPDAEGNFTITKATLNSADVDHVHEIADINDLQTTLDSKSNTTHTHNFVTGLLVGDTTLSSSIKLQTQGNLLAASAGQVVTLTATIPEKVSANAVVDTATQHLVKTFIGTEAEWDLYTPATNETYIVYIHD